MHITRALALKLLKRQEWDRRRTAMLARRPSALRWLRRRLTPNGAPRALSGS